MRLAEFIRANVEPILVEWEAFARSIWPDARAPVRLDGQRLRGVDDEPDVRRMLSQLLEGVGANVTVADNAQDALKAIASGAGGFDALVSDLAMPNHDGYDLIREICRRGHDAKPSLQLRSLGSRTATMQRRAILAGFQKHISKPVDVHHLTAILARFVGRTAQVVRSDAFREHRLPEARALGPNIPSGRALTCPAQAGPCVHSASY